MKSVGKSITKSLLVITLSPYKHVPFGACKLVTHYPFKQLFPESHIVPESHIANIFKITIINIDNK
jgi:hypothetical protein